MGDISGIEATFFMASIGMCAFGVTLICTWIYCHQCERGETVN